MSSIHPREPCTPKKFDHSTGHAFLSASGDIFYSPNCSRQVEVPVPSNSYPFHVRQAKFENFLSPRWWTQPYHYLSYITLRPSFEGAVFNCLRDIVPYIQPTENGRYALAAQTVNQWVQIEDALIMASRSLSRAYRMRVRAALYPIPSSLLGFNKSFYTHRSARLHIAASRDWFLVWMALLSSTIADIESFSEYDDRGDWFNVLAREKVPQDWLSAIQSSIVCDFSSRCPRVGTFLNIINPEPTQPSVEWFCSWNIPVWYCFGAGGPKLGHLQPPSHILQAATTFISKSPTLLPLPSPSSPQRQPQEYSPHQYSPDKYRKAQTSYLESKPWEAFFIARDQSNQKLLAKENEHDRQTRLNRERNPPTTSAEVFIWEWSEEDVIELIRRRVSKKERQDVLGTHSAAQRKYDPISNVWDVCEFFGDDDSDDDDDISLYDDDYDNDFGAESHVDLDTAQVENEAFIDERVRQSNTSLVYSMNVSRASDLGPEVDLTHAPNELNILRYLSLHFGFVPPLPLPERDPAPINYSDWDECLMSVGLRTNKHNPPQPGLTGPIVNFVRGLQAQGPEGHEYDLLPDNRQYLADDVVKKSFHKLNDSLYILDDSLLGVKRLSEWRIAVTTSANALYILRYISDAPETLSSMALARHLAEEGIPFQTLLVLDHLPSVISLDAIKTKIPRRVAKYEFLPEDYGTYVARRKQLLATPRARAAILCGGIVSRLAREHFAVESTVFGPSSAVTIHRLGYSFETAGMTYWDDGLTNDEIAVLCGMHHCYTGNGDQIAQVSWWPLPHYWDNKNNAYNWGYWTELDETWYQERLSSILQGDKKNGLPLPQTEWRSKLKKAPMWRKVVACNLDKSNLRFQ